MLLHLGFEKPTPEIMEAWKAWFEDVADEAMLDLPPGGGASWASRFPQLACSGRRRSLSRPRPDVGRQVQLMQRLAAVAGLILLAPIKAS